MEQTSRTKLAALFILLAATAFMTLSLFSSGCGRSASRYMGKAHRQVLQVENLDQFISISYDKNGTSTVKDITFKASDGYIYTQEFKDVSPLEGTIRWVPKGQSDSLVQSRALSRWTGSPVNLELPDDCADVLGVDIGYAGPDERVKNLTYRSKDGRLLSKEYREGIIDRQLEGWLEITTKAAK